MPSAITTEETTSIVQTDGAQAVRIPDEYRFASDRVYIRRDPESGVVQISEKPFRPSLQELWKAIDDAKDEEFELDRDNSFPRKLDLS